jgi:hypothetical protein
MLVVIDGRDRLVLHRTNRQDTHHTGQDSHVHSRHGAILPLVTEAGANDWARRHRGIVYLS